MLGLGLGLNKGNFIPKISDALLLALQQANATMCLIADRADGTNPGINSPLTNPLVGIIENDRIVNGVYDGEPFANNLYNLLDRLTIQIPIRNNIVYGGYSGTCGWKDPTPYTLKANTDYTFVTDGYTDTPYSTGGTLNVIGLGINDRNSSIEYGNTWLENTQTEQRVLVNVPVDTVVYVGGRPGASIDNTYVEYYLYEGDYVTGSPALPAKGQNVQGNTVVKDTNNALLTNFAGTTSSGYDDVTAPSRTVKMLKADGVDDYCVIANAPSLDPTGTEDFAICGVFKTGATLVTGYLFAKNLEDSINMQYGILPLSTGSFRIILNGVGINTASVFLTNTVYSFVVKRINENLKVFVNQTEQINQSNTTSLTTYPHIRVFSRSNSIDGTTQSSFIGYHLASLAFFYNGATGLNETDVDNACDLLFAPYF